MPSFPGMMDEKNMKSLLISGGSFDYDFVVSHYKKHKDAYDRVIAIDYGERYAAMAGIPVDLLVGDFDTRGKDGLSEYEKRGIPILQSVPEKDDTDTEMAIRECLRTGSDFDILCATGGRLDHLLGNLHNLKLGLDAGLRARLLDPQNTVELLRGERRLCREELPYHYISFLPYAGTAHGVRLVGLKYELSGADLEPGYSLGVSNEFVPGKDGYVSVEDGILIMINAKDKG